LTPDNTVYDITPDGQYALVLLQTPKTDAKNEPAATIALVERPGVIRAMLPVTMFLNSFPMLHDLILMHMSLSPDGKYFLAKVIPKPTTQPTRCILFQVQNLQQIKL